MIFYARNIDSFRYDIFLMVLVSNYDPVLNYNGDFAAFQIVFTAIYWLEFCYYRIDLPQPTCFEKRSAFGDRKDVAKRVFVCS